MKKRLTIMFLLMLILALALPTTAMAKGLQEGRVVFGGTYHLESGQTLDGDLVLFGAVATLEPDSVVHGSIVLIGANLESDAEVTGDVVGIGGLITLNETAVVRGDVITIGAHLDKSNKALIQGEATDISQAPFTYSFPGDVQMPQNMVTPFPEFNIVWYFLKAILWAALATLVVLFVPKASTRVAQAFTLQPLIAAGLGLLTIILAIPLAIVLIITILLSPLGLFVLILLGICWAFGVISIGMEIGKRIGLMFKGDWAEPVSAAVGTLLLILVIDGAGELIPCVGWIIPAVVGMVAVGAVLMTRFGTQSYPLYPDAPIRTVPTPPQPPAPAVVPAPPVVEAPQPEEETPPDSEEIDLS